MMVKSFVGIGSNIDKEHNIVSCIKLLGEIFGQLHLSPVYESPAVGFEGDNFFNMVVAFNTDKSPQEIHHILRDIERQHHRIRGKNRFESRTLDIDHLLHGKLILNDDGICLPSEEITQYAFILFPISDIASNLRHPITGKTFIELCNEFESTLPLKKINFEQINSS